jgi:hypothetical protein
MPNDEKQNKAADIDIEELNYAKEVVALHSEQRCYK